MSFKNFSHLNEFIATTADVTDKLNSIVSLCQQGLTQLSSVKQISDAYARQYSLVQQIQYDADGNIQDVTSADRLSVPDTVIHNAKDMINKCSLAIKRINPINLGSLIAELNIKPVAKIYKYTGVNTNAQISPASVTTIDNYYYTSNQALYLSSEFINALITMQGDAGFAFERGTINFNHPTVAKLPYVMQGISGNHQLSIIGSVIPEASYYLQHTGDFTKYCKLSDIAGKDVLSESSYNIEYKDIGNTIQWSEYSNHSGRFNVPNAMYGISGDILNVRYGKTDTYTADSIDCYYDVSYNATDNIWAVLTGLADNGAQIMNILNNL